MPNGSASRHRQIKAEWEGERPSIFAEKRNYLNHAQNTRPTKVMVVQSVSKKEKTRLQMKSEKKRVVYQITPSETHVHVYQQNSNRN